MRRAAVSTLVLLALSGSCETAATGSQTASPAVRRPQPRQARHAPRPQPRPYGQRIQVSRSQVHVNDGDTVSIRWKAADIEVVRILGIDAPEIGAPQHDIPHPQEFGAEARTFAQGAFAVADRVELLRASTLDAYGRTLAYVFLNGQNLSVLIVQARLAEESISRFGDNGLPEEAAAVARAAKEAGPLPFESPTAFRTRMRRLADWMKTQRSP